MAKVIALPQRKTFLHELPEQKLIKPPSVRFNRPTPKHVSLIDHSGKPKVVLLNGPNGAGKTILARTWTWKMHEAGRDAMIVAMDAHNRSLAGWFDGVQMPPTRDDISTSRWLQEILEFLMEDGKTSAIVDFGGGSMALERLAEACPDLHTALADAGLGVVSVYVLPPRPADLVMIKTIEDSGFQPPATMIVLNEGVIPDNTAVSAEDAFAGTVNHSWFREVVDRGAEVIWMPPLEWKIMTEIEERHLDFGQAANGRVPDGAQAPPIGGLARTKVTRWLRDMEASFAPCAAWLP